jgi:FkbM family methyltransferase
LKLAVEPSFRSIVTSVLLAEGDWFEAEMEFWRSQLQPGMMVIDVGANVGVYTFSAAQKVGATGRVLAVEPFSGCVRCMEETCRVNQLDWVEVCAGAASDRNGTIRLALQSASELNEVITDDSQPLKPGTYEEVPCFTLDSLIEQESLSRVDWLKIDAEGHEMQVLKGCGRLLHDFKPGILYENIAGTKADNQPVAEFLIAQGYELFRYQPHVATLIKISSSEDFQRLLNIIAVPSDKVA